jgi:GTP-binding protein
LDRFVDEALITVASGNGGDGSVHFRREKYVPRGGPDGGDGGRGGHVFFVGRANLKTLTNLTMRSRFRAQHGEPGRGRKKHGADGDDLYIEVPLGTTVSDAETGEPLADITEAGQRELVAAGGRGGNGNVHYKSSTNRTPRYAQEGKPGVERRLRVQLRLIADVGLVGLPNAGKSSLLASLTNARPKVADYPFTTRIPQLGVIRYEERELVMADIPGIIEGASEGAGLGHDFLRHISRTRALLFLLDLTHDPGREDFELLLGEVRSYNAELVERPRMILGSKLDLYGTDAALERLESELSGERVLGVSSFSRTGLDTLRRQLPGLTEGDTATDDGASPGDLA